MFNIFLLFVLDGNFFTGSFGNASFLGWFFFQQSHRLDLFAWMCKIFVSLIFSFDVKLFGHSKIGRVVESSRGQTSEHFIGVEDVWLLFGIFGVYYFEPGFLLLLERILLIRNYFQNWVYLFFLLYLFVLLQQWLDFNVHKLIVTLLILHKGTVKRRTKTVDADARSELTQGTLFELFGFIVVELFSQFMVIFLEDKHF